MSIHRSLYVTLWLSATLLGVSAATARDDWPQFRRDAQRSALSQDKIPVRLTELWNWEESSRASRASGLRLAESNRPIGPCAVWQGRIYSISLENKQPFLICAQVKSGRRLWQQPLNGLAGCRPEVGPAVSRSGIVYAYDTVPMNERQVHLTEDLLTDEQNAARRKKLPVFYSFPAAHVRLRAFNGVTGAPLGEFPLPSGFPRRQFNPLITRLFLVKGTLALLPGPSSHWNLSQRPLLGPALLTGDRLAVASEGDLVVQWQPGAPALVTRLCFPWKPKFLDLETPAKLQGFPLVQVNGGIAVADDASHRFLGVLGVGPRWEILETSRPERRLGSGAAMIWYESMPWSMGIASATQDTLLIGCGGLNAQDSIAAFDPQSGLPRWTYPRLLTPDPIAEYLDRWVVTLIGGRVIPPDEEFAAKWEFHSRALQSHPDAILPKPRRIRMDRDDWEIFIPHEEALSGQLRNLGLISSPEQVYGFVGQDLVAINIGTGKPLWTRPLRHGTRPLALIGAKDYLVVLQDSGPRKAPLLLGISRESGKLEWTTRLERPGQLVTAYSMVFVCEDGRLTAYAPAERTYRLAVDSDRREDYQRPVQIETEPTDSPPADEVKSNPTPEISDDPQTQLPEPDGLGDASLLRLSWSESTEALLAKIKARRQTVPGVPLSVVLDWLDRTRSERVYATARGGWTPAEIAAFAQTCAALAEAAQPDHFEVASEVNVYLARHPEEVEQVRALVRAARSAIARVSPHTRVLISYNCEVLGEVYGRTHYFPFGTLPVVKRNDRQAAITLAAEVEEVGLTTRPQSGFIQPGQIGPRYFLARKLELGNKPVVITHLETRFDETDAAAMTQKQFLRRLFQVTYWLDARLIAYSTSIQERNPALPDVALLNGTVHRPALAHWKDTLGWRWVEKLTADPFPLDTVTP